MTVYKALTIAGSDSSGGAGIQADLKTFAAHGVYGMSVITALTAQNTQGVRAIQDATPDMVGAQLDAVFEDIVPDAVKIGMVSKAETIEVIADRLAQYGAKNVVLDPVMVSTSGSTLLDPMAVRVLATRLIPLARVITPNIPEAQVLANQAIAGKRDMVSAAQEIMRRFSYEGAVLVKGGHLAGCVDDLLYMAGEYVWLSAPRVDTCNTHGTGCTLSSAIAAGLAQGGELLESVQKAKDYVTACLQAGLDLGKGSGPMDHGAVSRPGEAPSQTQVRRG